MNLTHDNQNTPFRDRLIRCPEVKNLTGLGRTTIYKMMGTGAFPKSVNVGRAALWSEGEVFAWIEAQKLRARAA